MLGNGLKHGVIGASTKVLKYSTTEMKDSFSRFNSSIEAATSANLPSSYYRGQTRPERDSPSTTSFDAQANTKSTTDNFVEDLEDEANYKHRVKEENKFNASRYRENYEERERWLYEESRRIKWKPGDGNTDDQNDDMRRCTLAEYLQQREMLTSKVMNMDVSE